MRRCVSPLSRSTALKRPRIRPRSSAFRASPLRSTTTLFTRRTLITFGTRCGQAHQAAVLSICRRDPPNSYIGRSRRHHFASFSALPDRTALLTELAAAPAARAVAKVQTDKPSFCYTWFSRDAAIGAVRTLGVQATKALTKGAREA